MRREKGEVTLEWWSQSAKEEERTQGRGTPLRSRGRSRRPLTSATRPEISSLMDFNSPDASLDKVLLREEVAQLQEEVHLLRQMKDMLSKDLEETQGSCSADVLSATELRVQLAQKEQELDRAKEALQAMKSDRKRLKAEKADLVNQMQQLYATLESREEQLRDFIRNYEQHRKESEDAVKALAKEKDLLEREKWDLRRQTKEATEHTGMLRSQLDLKENRIKELEAELAMMSNCVNQRMEYRVFERVADRDYTSRVMAAKQSLATLTKDVPKRHSLAMPTETVVNGNNQEWVMQADLPLTAAIRQSQQTLYVHTGHPTDRQVAAVRVSPCHSRQPSIISDASALEGDRSSTPSDINSPRHRTHSLCNSLEDLEEAKRKKKKEKMGLGSLSRVFARGKQRKSLDPGLFDDSDSLSSPTRHSLSLSDGSEDQLDRLQQVELARTTPMSQWRAGTVQAWLEVVMAMPMYIRTCSENVKSGKVLLGLTDEDLELGLGVSSLMHRRKLRLAIEDYRDAENGRGLSRAADMDHHWVAKAWLSDMGLPQYSQAFHNHLVDGRMLNSLTRRDLERHLNISKKFHQVSLLLGIELLHLLNFDKEALQARRIQCEHQNVDPLVWTSHRVIKWIKDIDLKEFAENLLNSGVHGAVMVLDPTFNTDTMATALGIPNSKHMVRRHLVEEMKTLIASARTDAKQDYERLGLGTPPTLLRQNSLGRPSSSTGRHTDDEGSLRRRAVKPPAGFSPKARSGRDLSCHSSYGSLPREDMSGNSSSTTGDSAATGDRKNKASSVAFVLVGSGVAMLLLSLCVGMRNKQREQLWRAQNQGGVAANAQGQTQRYAVPTYEEAVGSGQYPVRQSNLRPSNSQLPSYDDLVQVDGVQYEFEGSEVTTTGSQTASASSAAASASNRRPGKNNRKLLPIKIRRIKSEKLHMKNVDNSQPAAGISIEPLTPPPQYEDKVPPI
ncbi:Kazrin [Collichthys lucidus]|uniref:Kazrin n=1 Tax=Collichthys lucidus TaxID=240159 RepID=A0A4U5UQS2_COLLU|nr:Kazrin [Collichthys lucidus]